MAMTLTNSNFKNAQRLPIDQTSEKINASPHLSWENVPSRIQSLSIICDDPDVPSKTWTHWVIFNIPVTLTSLENAVTNDSIQAWGHL